MVTQNNCRFLIASYRLHKAKLLEQINKDKEQLKEAIMNNKVETTKEQVLEAAKESKYAKNLLQKLYPEVFENNTVLCPIGSIFFRDKYPNNVYAIIKKGESVVVMNVSYSTLWTEKKTIKISELKDPAQLTITVSEFTKLTGYVNLDEFYIVDRAHNHNLLGVIKRFSAKV